MYGDGEQSRDFTFIEDCVAANLSACKADGASGRVFNIACGVRTTLNELFKRSGISQKLILNLYMRPQDQVMSNILLLILIRQKTY